MTQAHPLRTWLTPCRAATEGIEQDQFDGLMKVINDIVVGTTSGALFTVIVFRNHPNGAALKVWLAVFLLISLWRLVWRSQYLRRQPRGDEARRLCVRSLRLALLHAAMWGLISVLLWRPDAPLAETVLQISVIAMCLGANIHLSPFYPVLRNYILLAMVPLVARNVAIGGVLHLILATMLSIIAYYSLRLGRVQQAMTHDVYDQRRRNAELASALKDENAVAEAARQRAEEASAARTRLFAAANHDLRQPLYAIGLLAQTLQSPYGAANATTLGARLVEGVDSLGHLLDELIELSRVDSGSLEARPAPFDLQALLAETTALFEPEARAKGLRLVLIAPPGVALGDRALIGRVLSNLVSNAVRYTARGLVTLRATPLAEGGWTVAVEDTGIGLAESEQARIFEEFYQVANPGRDRTLGVGLGLAIVKRLSDMLGLDIAVASVVGRGSRFTIRLPAATSEQADAAPLTPAADDALRGLRVLVVEDDAFARTALVQLLTSWGCLVAEAASAKQAIARIDPPHVATPPGCGLIDLRLAEGLASRDGLDVLQHLRRSLGAQWPAAIVTGDVGSARAQEARQAGVAVLYKPVRPMQLRAFLSNVAAQHQPN